MRAGSPLRVAVIISIGLFDSFVHRAHEDAQSHFTLDVPPIFLSSHLPCHFLPGAWHLPTAADAASNISHDEVGAPAVREPAVVALSGPVSKVLIPKPRGKVSRINRGGYNLQEKLGWPPFEYEVIRVSLTCSR